MLMDVIQKNDPLLFIRQDLLLPDKLYSQGQNLAFFDVYWPLMFKFMGPILPRKQF